MPSKPISAATEAVQSNITEYWRARASSYDDHRHSPARREPDWRVWTDVWAGALPPTPCEVLDVGTGTGYVAGIIAKLGHRVTGIDLAPEMLDVAVASHADLADPPTLMVGDAVDPPFDLGTFDVICARYVLWTLRHPDVALTRWRELLRPGGLVAVVDSTWFPQGIDDGTSVKPGSREENLRRLYDHTVREALPLAETDSIGPTAEHVAAAGFIDVTITPLEELYELDARVGVSEGHEVQMQYLITGMAP